jgi:hypothetical protein
MNVRGLATIAIFILLITLIPPPVSASEPGSTSIWSGIWNGEQLTVAVIARGHDNQKEVRKGGAWWKWGNTSTDAYLFYWSDDEMVDLILDFSMTGDRPQALLYAPKVLELRSAITVQDDGYTLPEGLTPDLIISPIDGEWLIDGQPNFNLLGQEANPTSGVFEWSIRVGSDDPGVPNWVIHEPLPGAEIGEGDPKFGAMVRMDPDVPFELATPLMPTFPYLSAVKRENHFGAIQPIYFSPRQRSFEQNWTGFHIAGMYQINSISSPPLTDFESPFAFYQFDRGAERHANLVVRSDIWPAGSPHGPPPHYNQRTAVRMSWTGEVSHLWRYSLSVSGNYSHDEEVMIGDTKVFAVPYQEYPYWIASKPWKAATFVEAIDGETGSEGIYEFSVEDNHAVTAWINGLRLDPPVEVLEGNLALGEHTLAQLEREPVATLRWPYLDLPFIHPLRLREGFRGEYSLQYDRVPQLYFSTIDNRPHLLYATEGIWNLGSGNVLRTKNLDGEAYIDAWIREYIPKGGGQLTDDAVMASPGKVRESLYTLSDFILYAHVDYGVRLLRLDQPLIYRDLPVPTDEERWREFLETVEGRALEERDPHDLGSWLDGMAGDVFDVKRAEVEDPRITTDGFRFVITLRPNFRVVGTDYLGLEKLAPGAYVVSYDGDFTIAPLTAPELSASLADVSPIQLQPTPMILTVRNDGLQDVVDGIFELTAISETGQQVLIDSYPFELASHKSSTKTLQWAPPHAGQWNVTATIELPDGTYFNLDLNQVTAMPTHGPTVLGLLAMSTSLATRMLTIVGIGLLAVVATLTWRSAWRTSAIDGSSNDR